MYVISLSFGIVVNIFPLVDDVFLKFTFDVATKLFPVLSCGADGVGAGDDLAVTFT